MCACALRPSGLEPPGHLRREFGIAQRGYDDGLPVAPATGTDAEQQEDATGQESRSTALSAYLERRERQLKEWVGAALDLLEVPEPRGDLVAGVIALIEGLTLSVCLGRLTPDHATALAVEHVLGLRPRRWARPRPKPRGPLAKVGA